MAKPTNRQELVEYALRRLGAPVLEINVADEQLDDILDDTIQHFQERHYDGVIRTYLKYEFDENDIKRGGDNDPFYQANVEEVPGMYPGATGVTVDRFVENSNYINLPPHIIGVENVMTPPQATGGGSYYPGGGILGPGASPYGSGYGYLGGMGSLGGTDMISMYMYQAWRSTYDFLSNPPGIIRFNKRQDRLYLDINWNRLSAGQIIIVECYRALDPEHFCEIYNDSWVKKYLVAAIKKQWGQNLIKFTGTKLPGGIEMNGRQLYDDGVRELEEIKNDMSSTYELPPLDFVG
jgi:hypothetical protein